MATDDGGEERLADWAAVWAGDVDFVVDELDS